jgi:hypothetical protein
VTSEGIELDIVRVIQALMMLCEVYLTLRHATTIRMACS